VQDGTGHGPGRGGRSEAEGARRQRAPGGGRVHHAAHTGRPHQRDGVHDRRESGRHDQGKLAEMIEPPQPVPSHNIVLKCYGESERWTGRVFPTLQCV